MKRKEINGEFYDFIENMEDVFTENKGRELEFVMAYEDYYYIRFKPKHFYDMAVYKVHCKTKEATVIHYLEYSLVEDKATPVNPDTLRKAG